MYDLRLKNIPAEVWMGILVLACTILLFTSGVKNVLPASGSVEKKVILIDAGHGGDDPGKIGINQAKEKDINLAIAKKLKVCLEKAGFEVVMTREADESVKGPEQGNKKSRRFVRSRSITRIIRSPPIRRKRLVCCLPEIS